jgi:hypothetical protein
MEGWGSWYCMVGIRIDYWRGLWRAGGLAGTLSPLERWVVGMLCVRWNGGGIGCMLGGIRRAHLMTNAWRCNLARWVIGGVLGGKGVGKGGVVKEGWASECLRRPYWYLIRKVLYRAGVFTVPLSGRLLRRRIYKRGCNREGIGYLRRRGGCFLIFKVNMDGLPNKLATQYCDLA